MQANCWKSGLPEYQKHPGQYRSILILLKRPVWLFTENQIWNRLYVSRPDEAHSAGSTLGWWQCHQVNRKRIKLHVIGQDTATTQCLFCSVSITKRSGLTNTAWKVLVYHYGDLTSWTVLHTHAHTRTGSLTSCPQPITTE